MCIWLQEALSEAQSQAAYGAAQLKQAFARVAELTRDNASLRARCADSERAVHEAQESTRDTVHQLESALRRVAADRESSNTLTQQLAEAEETVGKLRALVAQTQTSAQLQQERAARLGQAAGEREEEVVQLENKVARLQERLAEKERFVRTAQEATEAAEARVRHSERVCEGLRQEAERTALLTGDLRAQCVQLREALEGRGAELEEQAGAADQWQRAAQALEGRLRAAEEQCRELDALCSRRRAEADTAAADTQLLVQENQAVTAGVYCVVCIAYSDAVLCSVLMEHVE